MIAPAIRPGGRPLAAEDELVLLLARAELDAAAARRARELLAGPLAWPRALGQARVHRVLPLVHRQLDALAFRGVPDDARAALAEGHRLHAARGALAARQLARALEALAAAGVGAIPLKGVVLGERLHGPTVARAISDLDLLVRRRDVARAVAALGARGYRAEDDAPVGEPDAALALESNMECSLVPTEPGDLLRIDVHWDIAWRWRGDDVALDDLWAEARPARWRDAPMLAMSAEWETLYLAVHAARHRWGQLKWLVDVHEIARRGEVDWDRAAEKAKRLGWLDVLRITCTACRTLLGSPVPDRLCLAALPGWLALYPEPPRPPRPLAENLLPLRLLRGGSRASYLGRLLFRPTAADRRALPLPRALGFLYRPVRLARLGTRWLRARSPVGGAEKVAPEFLAE